MLKNISNFGSVLTKEELKTINGGFAYTFFIEGNRTCIDCSRPIMTEDDPTHPPSPHEWEAAGCREVSC